MCYSMLMSWLKSFALLATLQALSSLSTSHAQPAPVDLSKYDPASSVRVQKDDDTLILRWRAGEVGDAVNSATDHGELALNLTSGQPLIHSIGIAPNESEAAAPILRNIDPVTILTVGERNLERRSGWTIFFDKVH